MEFGIELDDDLFETSRNKETKEFAEYSPKVYSKEWFIQSDCNETEEEHITQLKSHADYLYYQNKYSDSVKKYLECLENFQSSNITLRRDCLEGISRSYLHQRQLSGALSYALELFGIACSVNHKVVAWRLLASIYHQMGRYSDELDALHCCLQHHQWNYDFWLRLAFCYSGLFGVELNSQIQNNLLCNSENHGSAKQLISEDMKTKEGVLKHDSNRESNAGLSSTPSEGTQSKLSETSPLEPDLSEGLKNENVIKNSHDDTVFHCGQHSLCSVEDMQSIRRGTKIVCACLVRARLLLQTCILGYNSFARESNTRQQEQIALLLNLLDIEESIVEHCTQVYLRDIGREVVDSVEDTSVLEKLKEKSAAKEEQSCENIARRQFEAKWFGWLLTK